MECDEFVSMVNNEMSAKSQALLDKAEEMLTVSPGQMSLIKDTFLRPDQN